MKINQFFNLWLVLFFLDSTPSLANGQGKGASPNQAVTVKEEVQLDASCDENMFEIFSAKQSCLLNPSSASSCLSILVLSSVGAGTVGKYVGTAFESLMKKQPPE